MRVPLKITNKRKEFQALFINKQKTKLHRKYNTLSFERVCKLYLLPHLTHDGYYQSVGVQKVK